MNNEHMIHRPLPDKKYFTVEEANRALPYVSRIIDDVVVVYSRIVELRRELEHTEPGDGTSPLERNYESAMDRLSALIDELHTLGVELKDFEKGLIDFPSVHEDREIYLCWHNGESSVGYWHEVDTGYTNRQDVTILTQPMTSHAA